MKFKFSREVITPVKAAAMLANIGEGIEEAMERVEKGGRTVQDLANKWAGSECTLDGEPAKVIGRRLPFATVTTLDGSKHHEWSWEGVDRVMHSGGKFKS